MGVETTEDTDNSPTFEEVVEQTQGPRARIVEGLRFYGDDAHAQQLRRYGDVPSGRYHFHKLQDQEIIEEVGEAHVGRGGTATVYRLTEFGNEIADALDGPSDGAVTIAELEDRIEHQSQVIQETQDEIEELQQRYNAIADFVEEIDERVDAGSG